MVVDTIILLLLFTFYTVKYRVKKFFLGFLPGLPKIYAPYRPENPKFTSANCKYTRYIHIKDEISFVRNFTEKSWIMIHVRDPVARMVSSYYSLGWTHKAPQKNSKEYNAFICNRNYIQSLSLDEYVIKNHDHEVENLERLIYLLNMLKLSGRKYLLSTYETMMANFTYWHQNVVNFIGLVNDTRLVTLYNDMHSEVIRVNSGKGSYIVHKDHVRSGKMYDYLQLLKPSTLVVVEKVLEVYRHLSRYQN